MRKTLFTGALVLTIATSMVAGTMAIYTHADTISAGDDNVVVAKNFYVNSKATVEKIDIKLAPGESQDWDFTVTNQKDSFVSEVDMDVNVEVAFTGANKAALPDVNCDLMEGDKVVAKGVRDAASGKVSLESDPKAPAFTANQGAVKNYTLRFYWKDKDTNNDVDDTAIGNKPADSEIRGISVTVTGKQNTENGYLN